MKYIEKPSNQSIEENLIDMPFEADSMSVQLTKAQLLELEKEFGHRVVKAIMLLGPKGFIFAYDVY